MSDEETTKRGPSWKFWATTAFSIIGFLVVTMVGYYVKVVSDNMKKQHKMSVAAFRLLRSQQNQMIAIDQKVDLLGMRVYGKNYDKIKSLIEKYHKVSSEEKTMRLFRLFAEANKSAAGLPDKRFANKVVKNMPFPPARKRRPMRMKTPVLMRKIKKIMAKP